MKGSMPPWYYPWAGLSAAERQDLNYGLEATLGSEPGKGKPDEKKMIWARTYNSAEPENLGSNIRIGPRA